MVLPENNALGFAIRDARMNIQISQERLAEMVDVTPTHIKHIESGHRKPSVELLFAIAGILNLSLDNVLFPATSKDLEVYREVMLLINQCSEKELNVLKDMISSMIENR